MTNGQLMTNQCDTVLETSPDDAPRFFFQTIIVDHGIYPSITMHTRLFQTEPFWIHMKSTIYIVCHLFSKKNLCATYSTAIFCSFREADTTRHTTPQWGWAEAEGWTISNIPRLTGRKLRLTFFFKHLWETSQRMPRVVQKGFAFIHFSLPSNETARLVFF